MIVFALFALGTATAQDFKGWYAGVNLGGAFGHSQATTTTVFSPTGYFATTSVPAIAAAGNNILQPTRLTGGFQGGFNIQNGSWVFGLEANMGSMHLSDASLSGATYPCCAPTAFTINQSISTGWLFTAAPRIGFAHGPVLLYGTGGLAVTDLNYQSVFNDTFATAHENGGVTNNTRGWVYGGGIELKKSKHWSLKGEFVRVDFGSVTATSNNLTAFSPPIAFPTNVFTHTADLKANIFRAGASFYF
jgi:outer membrane immunogenic protein